MEKARICFGASIYGKNLIMCQVEMAASSTMSQIKIKPVKSNKRSGPADGHVEPSVLKFPGSVAMPKALKPATSRA
jgi:hypothetical protein